MYICTRSYTYIVCTRTSRIFASQHLVAHCKLLRSVKEANTGNLPCGHFYMQGNYVSRNFICVNVMQQKASPTSVEIPHKQNTNYTRKKNSFLSRRTRIANCIRRHINESFASSSSRLCLLLICFDSVTVCISIS